MKDKGFYVVMAILFIGAFGMIWTNNISDIDISMDENTRDAIMSFNDTLKELEIPDIATYDASECKFIEDIDEYWCVAHSNS